MQYRHGTALRTNYIPGRGYGLKRNIFLKTQTQGLVCPVIDIYRRQHTGERCRLSFLRAFFRLYRSWRGDAIRARAAAS